MSDTKPERCKRFVDWFAAQQAAEVTAVTAALLCGQTVRLRYDSDAHRFVHETVEVREW